MKLWARALALGGWMATAAAAASTQAFVGWRTQTSPSATPPASWTPAVWHARLGAAGNGSPVVVGSRVLVTAEPTRLVAVDLASGKLLWDRNNAVVDTLDPSLAGLIRTYVDRAPAMERELAELKRSHSALLRDARASADPAITAQLAASTARMAEITSTLDTVKPYLTPGTHDDIGYASPTPATDGRAAFALFGNGVVSRYELDGRRTWTRWLGPSNPEKNGYVGVDAASPCLAAGLLVVPYRNLLGLNPATGATVWTGPAWPHYGSPTLTQLGGRDVLLTPDGLAIDAASGRTLTRGLGALFYTSPHADGDRVWYVGSNAAYNSNAPNEARGWRLVPDGGGLRADPIFHVDFPTNDRVYSVPVTLGERLFVVTRQKYLLVLDAQTGAVLSKGLLSEKFGEVWAPLVAANGRVYATTHNGTVYEIDGAPPFAVLAEQPVSPNASTPWLQGGAVIWRGRDGLDRFGAP